jgi:hypothetical protein
VAKNYYAEVDSLVSNRGLSGGRFLLVLWPKITLQKRQLVSCLVAKNYSAEVDSLVSNLNECGVSKLCVHRLSFFFKSRGSFFLVLANDYIDELEPIWPNCDNSRLLPPAHELRGVSQSV